MNSIIILLFQDSHTEKCVIYLLRAKPLKPPMQLEGILTPKLNMIIKTDITPLNFKISEIEPSVGPAPIRLSSKKIQGLK